MFLTTLVGGVRRGGWWLAVLAGVCLMPVARAEDKAVFVMKPDGSGLRKVVQVEGFGNHGSVRFSHDDRRLVFDAGNDGNNTYRFFLVNVDGSGLKELGAHAMPDLSPDDKQVAYHSYGTNTQAGVYVQNLDGQGRVFLTKGGSPRWSPDGSQIAYTDWSTVRILDFVTGEQRALVTEPFESYQIGFDWSPDGKRLAFVGKRNGQNELWIADTSAEMPAARVRFTGEKLSTHVAWSADGKQLALTRDGNIYLLEVDSQKDPELVPGQEGINSGVAWSHDGRWIAFASSRAASGGRQAAGKSTWKLVSVGENQRGAPAYNVAISSDGTLGILGGHTGKAGFQTMDVESRALVGLPFQGVLMSLAPNDRTLAVSGLNQRVQLVDLTKGEAVKNLDHETTVTSVRFSSDGTRLVCGMLSKKAKVWSVPEGETVATFDKHGTFVLRAIFTRNGKEAISASQDKTVRVWDAKTAAQRLELPHPEPVWGLAVTPDGRQLLTGTGGSLPQNPQTSMMSRGDDNTLRLWDLETGKLNRELKGHTHAIYAIEVTSDGRLAVTGSWDGTIRVWDLQSGDEVARAQGASSVTDVKLSADNKLVLVGSGATRYEGEQVRYFGNERARLYRLTQEDAAAEAPAN